MDTSSSMEEECYGELKMKKIDAVKELFDSFATRTMAYDFHHVIGLASFSSKVTVIHTFTETLEKFKVVFYGKFFANILLDNEMTMFLHAVIGCLSITSM